ncbi:hypothetical protein V493_04101 [Pseudogymnoascus sp. VKM F-4281 (FW-2241)]|nr:hypothetical protein V493_04101 [Pseudogymnoascus sp. VKM F-4281 (FW-2241)]
MKLLSHPHVVRCAARSSPPAEGGDWDGAWTLAVRREARVCTAGIAQRVRFNNPSAIKGELSSADAKGYCCEVGVGWGASDPGVE